MRLWLLLVGCDLGHNVGCIGDGLVQGPMVGVVFHATGQPVFQCLFCGISRPMFCPWWFRWAVGHNAGHQGELAILWQSGRNPDEIFGAMMGCTR